MPDVFNTFYPFLHIDEELQQFGQNCMDGSRKKISKGGGIRAWTVLPNVKEKNHSICVLKVYTRKVREGGIV